MEKETKNPTKEKGENNILMIENIQVEVIYKHEGKDINECLLKILKEANFGRKKIKI